MFGSRRSPLPHLWNITMKNLHIIKNTVLQWFTRMGAGPRMKLASCKSALNPTVVCSSDRSKAVAPMLVLLFVALWFILRGDLFYVLPCVILFLCVFSHFSIAITSLREERANLSAFHTFVRFALIWFCLFSLPLGVWEGLRFSLWHSLDFSLTFFTSYWCI